MDPHQKLKEMCPFCHQETLEILWWPSHTAAHISRSAVAKNTSWSKKPEGHELLSDKCSNCGKSATEIQKAWKEGISESSTPDQRKRRLEELKKLGFSGVIS